jgi:hypothetical protein
LDFKENACLFSPETAENRRKRPKIAENGRKSPKTVILTLTPGGAPVTQTPDETDCGCIPKGICQHGTESAECGGNFEICCVSGDLKVSILPMNCFFLEGGGVSDSKIFSSSSPPPFSKLLFSLHQ